MLENDVLTPPTSGRQVRFADELPAMNHLAAAPMYNQFNLQQTPARMQYGTLTAAGYGPETPSSSDYSICREGNQPNFQQNLSHHIDHEGDASVSELSEAASESLFLPDDDVDQHEYQQTKPSYRKRAATSPLDERNRYEFSKHNSQPAGVTKSMSNPSISKRQRTKSAPPVTITRVPKRKRPEQDPENHQILMLRIKDLLSWSDIASIMNKQRVENGEQPSFTEAAVYGRFVRNGPRVADAIGEEDFDPKDWMHIKKAGTVIGEGELRAGRVGVRASPPAKLSIKERKENKLLAVLVDETQEEAWNTVAERMENELGGEWSVEACKERYNQV